MSYDCNMLRPKSFFFFFLKIGNVVKPSNELTFNVGLHVYIVAERNGTAVYAWPDHTSTGRIHHRFKFFLFLIFESRRGKV